MKIEWMPETLLADWRKVRSRRTNGVLGGMQRYVPQSSASERLILLSILSKHDVVSVLPLASL